LLLLLLLYVVVEVSCFDRLSSSNALDLTDRPYHQFDRKGSSSSSSSNGFAKKIFFLTSR